MICMLRFTYIVFSFFIATKVIASPFYLTVESSFSPNENAKIRLDYQDDKNEMELRILKPIQLDKFLEGQLNISRTYEEPKSKLNPGYFIAKGINNVDLPLEKLRKFISPKFRLNFTDNLSNAIKINPKMATVDKRKSIFILPPASTKIIEKFRISLLADSKQIDGESPGFEGDFYGDISYKQKNISLPKLPAGIYLIQVVQGNNEAQSILQISDIAVQVKQSTNQLLITAIDRALKPVTDAIVHVRDSRGKWEKLPRKTNQYGQLLWEQATPFDSKLIVRVEKNTLNAFASTEFLSVSQAKSDIFLMTDRPIFKPGEEVFFKGIMRSREQNQLVFPLSILNKQIKRLDTIEVLNNKGENIQNLQGAELTKFGSFSGKINLAAEQIPGIYQIHAKTDQTPYSGEFRVRDYVKPNFYLSLEKIKGNFHPGNKITLKMKAIRYAGGAANDARFEVYVYRKKFEVPQWLSEEGFDLQSGLDYFGKKLSNSHNIPVRVYSSVEERHTVSDSASVVEEDNHSKYKLKESTEGVFSGSWTTAHSFDVNGQAEFRFQLPKNEEAEEEWVYSLMIKAMDSQGSQAILTENYPVTLSEAFSTIVFKNKIIDIALNSNELFIYSSLPNGDLAPFAKGQVELKLVTPEGKEKSLSAIEFKTDKNGIAVINVPKMSTVGKIIATAKLSALNDKKMQTPSVSDPAEQIIADNKNSLIFNNKAVELYANIQHVEVNNKVKFLALLPESWGVIEKGIGWLTIAGDRIFEQKTIELSGRSQWLEVEAKEHYGSGFYVTLTVPSSDGKFLERSTSFKIIKKSKILNVNIQPEKLVAEPMKNLKINFKVIKNDGSAAANTELAVAIVDKAVYDVQNEFRPKIFDFFYPDPKLNLMTFYSDDLQGYGFADHIRKENFDLYALKAKNQLAKNNMRDTAGWFPHVVTDAAGNAQITVNMPANVTHWVINAVAIDSEGKFGEAKTTFRTATDITTTPNISQFMRENDALNFSVRYANTTSTSTSIKTKIQASEGLGELNKSESAAGKLLGLQDSIATFKIKATNSFGTGKLTFALNAGNLTTGGNHEYGLKLLPNGISQIIPAKINNNSLAFNVSSQTKVTDIHILASYGMTGYALFASQWLATYPYGCTEQLVSSTLPNLVLLKLFKDLGISTNQLGDYAETFTKAQVNAELGIKKLLENQLTNGAFSMWKQDPMPNIYMSIIAASGMQEAINLGLSTDIHEPLEHVKQWLRDQKLKELLFENSKLKNENFLFLKKAALLNILPNDLLEIIFKDILNAKDENISLDTLVYAIEILENWQNNHDSIWKIKMEHKQTLLSRLQELLIKENELLKTRFKISQINNLDATNGLPFAINDLILYSAAYNLLAKNDLVNHEFEKIFKDRMIEILNENKNSFGSTFLTSQVILNLKDIIKLEIKKLKLISKNDVKLLSKNKDKIANLKTIPGGFAINYKTQQASSVDLQQLELENLPEGFAIFAYMKAFVPTKEIHETDNGFSLKKEFFRYNEKNSKLEKVNLSDLKIGNIVFTKSTISRSALKNSRYRHSNYFILEDNIPSLGEILDTDQHYFSDAEVKQPKSLETKRYADKIVHVFELPYHEGESKPLEVYSVWRVNFTGESSIPASKVTDMYNENIFGISASFEVKNK